MVSYDELLDVALDRFTEFGLRRTTTDDIARTAGVDRATVYRRLGSKDAIVQAVVLREVERFTGEIRAQVLLMQTREEWICAGFAITVLRMRVHPLLRRLRSLKEYETLAALTVDSAPAFAVGAAFIRELIREGDDRFGRVGNADDAAVGLVARMIHSLVFVPDAEPVLETEAELRDFAQRMILPLFA